MFFFFSLCWRHLWWRIRTKICWTLTFWVNLSVVTFNTAIWRTTTWPTLSIPNFPAEFGGNPGTSLGASPISPRKTFSLPLSPFLFLFPLSVSSFFFFFLLWRHPHLSAPRCFVLLPLHVARPVRGWMDDSRFPAAVRSRRSSWPTIKRRINSTVWFCRQIWCSFAGGEPRSPSI